MSEKIVQLNEEVIKGQLKELVRGSVEETLNELLEQEAEQLTQAARYERSEGQIVKKAVYVAIGLDMEGKRDVLGMWIGENESAKFWLGILNSLKNRGVEDILIACVDGLTGFTNAIEAVYPRTEVQQCIIHQIRNTTRFVSYKDIKKLMKDLKLVYGAVDESIDAYKKRKKGR